MKLNTKKAFTITETLMTLTIVSFIMGITIANVSKITPDSDKAKFKKAYANIEGAVYRLINNNLLYPNNKGFSDTKTIILQETGETIGFNGPKSKFREAMQYELNIVKNKFPCKLYNNMYSPTGCFLNEDGVVYGIPDTDFNTNGTVSIEGFGQVVPIVLYTNWNADQTVNDDAFIVGVRRDGSIKILYTVKCNKNSNEMQCNSVKYLKSGTIKRET